MMKINFAIICFFLINVLFGQITKTESLALEYYKQGEFGKAAQLFEDVYKAKKNKSIYAKYIDCLIKIQKHKQAEKIIKNFFRK